MRDRLRLTKKSAVERNIQYKDRCEATETGAEKQTETETERERKTVRVRE
jgi:hypothetical protein